MRQFHFYDASGLLHSNSIVVNAPDHEAVAQKNCPAGHKVVEGVFDPLCQRIDDAAHLRWKALRDELVQLSLEDQLPRLAELGSLRAQVAVDHQPAQPSADHEWNPHTK